MSINHFFSHTPHYPHTMEPSSLNFNLNQHSSSSLPPLNPPHIVDSLFEKPLTPSDVGKLNRLVIPKQHAEKYFPLAADSSGDKGLLLSFEDESGKCWRFRYSYWNSSQSYVLTKGWSRYVKEKQLDAGDVVLFQRHRTEVDRFFIGWRRRGENCNENNNSNGGGVMMVQGSNGGGWNRGLMYTSSSSSNSGQQQQQHGSHGGTSISCQPDSLHAGSASSNQLISSGNSKKFRLFGVNVECQLDESEPSTPDDGSSLSSQGPNSAYHHLYSQSNRMDSIFSQDVNQMKNRRG